MLLGLFSPYLPIVQNLILYSPETTSICFLLPTFIKNMSKYGSSSRELVLQWFFERINLQASLNDNSANAFLFNSSFYNHLSLILVTVVLLVVTN